MSDDDLIALGFVRTDIGALIAPPTVGMRFTPTGRFYEIRISIANGNIITVVVPKVAVKVVQGVKL